MKKKVLFIQGGGQGAYEEDKKLATYLQAALGAAYEVRYPKMPDESAPDYEPWKGQIQKELAALEGEVILVGHSLGGSVLLKYISEEQIEKSIAGLFLIAAPYWGGDDGWQYEGFTLGEDAVTKLLEVPHIFFYHSRDDDIVPFAHLRLYAEKIPQATFREFDERGHQFNNNLVEVVEDLKSYLA